MNIESLRTTPIRRIWDIAGRDVWDRDAPEAINTLKELESGKSYWFLSDKPYTFELFVIHEGWSRVQWWEIAFIGGRWVTTKDWEWIKEKLVRTELYPLLKYWNVQRIEVRENISWAGPDALATIWQADRAILLKDMPWFPPLALPATILHEGVHLWQADNNLAINELQAYSVTQLFHWLNGDALRNIFDGVVYLGAKGLLTKA